jgi:hypothetical protein
MRNISRPKARRHEALSQRETGRNELGGYDLILSLFQRYQATHCHRPASQTQAGFPNIEHSTRVHTMCAAVM